MSTLENPGSAIGQAGQKGHERLGSIAGPQRYRNWLLVDDHQPGQASMHLQCDEVLARSAVEQGTAVIRIWQSDPGLVVGQSDLKLAGWAEALGKMERAGWPVSVRQTGGTAVPQGPGILNLSLIWPEPGDLTSDEVFHALMTPVQQALHSMGILTRPGAAPGAICDGRYNLLAGRQKIAGTAQAWRSIRHEGARHRYILGHLVLFVACFDVNLTEVANQFYGYAGGQAHYDADTLTTVQKQCRALMPARSLVAEVRHQLVTALKRWVMAC
ncbi:MAG: lipoyl protein ligase domain-containing protein [Sulfobacillus sp.]